MRAAERAALDTLMKQWRSDAKYGPESLRPADWQLARCASELETALRAGAAARPEQELAAIIRERDEALAAWKELRLWAEENGWLDKATRSNKASEMLAAGEPPTYDAAREPKADKAPNPCPVCGAFLWDDPRPCWNCARHALLAADGGKA